MAIYDCKQSLFIHSNIYLNRRKTKGKNSKRWNMKSMFHIFIVFTIISCFMFVFSFSLGQLKYFNNFLTVVIMNIIEKEKKLNSLHLFCMLPKLISNIICSMNAKEMANSIEFFDVFWWYPSSSCFPSSLLR